MKPTISPIIVHAVRLACIPLLLILSAGYARIGLAAEPASSASWSAVVPGFLPGVRADAGDLPVYEITAVLIPGDRRLPAVIDGSMRLTGPLVAPGETAVALRLYPNDPGYEAGSMTIRDITVDGAAAQPAYLADDTVALIPVEAGDGADRPVELALDFRTEVPVHSRHAFGMFSVKPESGVMSLAHWYPMLAGRTGSGPDLAPPSQIGDPVFSPPALFDLTFSAPANWVLLTGGVMLERSVSDGLQTARFAIGPAREAPVVAGTNWSPVTVTAGETTVNVWAEPEDADHARRVAGWTVASLDLFGRLFGPYPFRELDVAVADLYGAAGMEFPGIVLISPDVLRTEDTDRRFPEMVVVHEVAHQWWYGLVLNDQNAQAFIDEGISEYVAAEVYFADQYGEAEGRRQFDLLVGEWMDGQLASNGDLVVDQPTEAYGNRSRYAAAVYAKASLGLDALRAQIGDEAFFGALRQLAETRRFEVIDGDDLESAFASACGCDIGPLWQEWFEETRLDE